MSNRRRPGPVRPGERVRARRRVGILVAGLSSAVLLPAPARPARAEPPHSPNIILVLADDLGYRDPSIYAPNTVSPTPHLDRLADAGIRFLDAHSPASFCTRSARYCA